MTNINNNKIKLAVLSIISSCSFALTACQSNMGLTNQQQKPIQLFDTEQNPSNSELAKRRLVLSMDHLLKNEYYFVAQTQSQVRPFIENDSVDVDSNSLFVTLVKSYKKKKQIEKEKQESEKKYLIEQFTADIYQEIDDGELDELSEEQVEELVEERYRDSLAEQNKSNEDDIRKNANHLVTSYLQLKAEREDNNTNSDSQPSSDISDKYSWITGDMLRYTPEQVAAYQEYDMQYLKINTVGHYLPEEKQQRIISSLDINAPTHQISAQFPLTIDFDDTEVKVDPSAFMPFMALLFPEDMLTPEEMSSYTVELKLPKEVNEQVPVGVVYDAFVNSIIVAFNNMDNENYTAVDISGDSFAQNIGASQAVKVHFDSKQAGEFLGKLFKSMAKELKSHIDKNPDLYQERKKLVAIVEQWSSINQDFQSNDMGSLLQIVEAVAPISFHQSNYYYLNSDNKLLAAQYKASVGSDLLGLTVDSIQQKRYGKKLFKQHSLYPLYAETLSDTANKSIDGNGVISEMLNKKQWKKMASNARYEYPAKALEETEASVASKNITKEENTQGLTDEMDTYKDAKDAFLKFEK